VQGGFQGRGDARSLLCYRETYIPVLQRLSSSIIHHQSHALPLRQFWGTFGAPLPTFAHFINLTHSLWATFGKLAVRMVPVNSLEHLDRALPSTPPLGLRPAPSAIPSDDSADDKSNNARGQFTGPGGQFTGPRGHSTPAPIDAVYPYTQGSSNPSIAAISQRRSLSSNLSTDLSAHPSADKSQFQSQTHSDDQSETDDSLSTAAALTIG
jgi:hypothetical protein